MEIAFIFGTHHNLHVTFTESIAQLINKHLTVQWTVCTPPQYIIQYNVICIDIELRWSDRVGECKRRHTNHHRIMIEIVGQFLMIVFDPLIQMVHNVWIRLLLKFTIFFVFICKDYLTSRAFFHKKKNISTIK